MGKVGCQYNNKSYFQLVLSRLMKEFEELDISEHEAVTGMIEKCSGVSKSLYYCQQKEKSNTCAGESSSDDNDDDKIEKTECNRDNV